jgi:lipoprotein LprG
MKARSARGRGLTIAAAIATLALGALASGCSDETPEATPDELRDRLAAAKTQIDEAASVEFSLAADELPDDEIGILEASGVGTHEPAFEGEVNVNVTGGQAKVIAVDGEVYAKPSFSLGYSPIDPSQLGGPDPAVLFDTETGVTSFLTSTDDLAAGEDSRDGNDVLSTITGTLPGDIVQRLIPKADGAADFDVTYRLTEDDALRDVVITGPFYGDGGDVTYTMSLDASDDTVEITAP